MMVKRSFQKILFLPWSLAIMALAIDPVDALVQEHSQQSQSRAVKVQMHNVIYRFNDSVSVHIRSLAGELAPTSGDLPVFEDKNSFTLHLTAAEIAISSKSLADVLNSYVFARRDAPVKEVSIRIENNRVKVKGKLHHHDDVSFETEGELSATTDGKIRLHAHKIRALHLPVKGLMDLFGLDLADLIKTGKIRGVQVEKDDVILDPSQIFPPPHIAGKITDIRLQGDYIVQIFGSPQKYPWAKVPAQNYMAFSGNRLRLGKLTMDNTDLVLIDVDPRDALDFYLDHYQEQLAAGYTKITKDFGLRVFMVDYGKLKRAAGNAAKQ
jgi:hypothetical protein